MNAMERLNKLVKEKGVFLAGLDPDINKILPNSFQIITVRVIMSHDRQL